MNISSRLIHSFAIKMNREIITRNMSSLRRIKPQKATITDSSLNASSKEFENHLKPNYGKKSLWKQYEALTPGKKLIVTLSFTLPGMIGLLLIDDDNLLSRNFKGNNTEERNDQESFISWLLRTFKEEVYR